MNLEGGCYCKQIRYESTGEIGMKIQCFCRECQYITGGDWVSTEGFIWEDPEDVAELTIDFRWSGNEDQITRNHRRIARSGHRL